MNIKGILMQIAFFPFYIAYAIAWLIDLLDSELRELMSS